MITCNYPSLRRAHKRRYLLFETKSLPILLYLELSPDLAII